MYKICLVVCAAVSPVVAAGDLPPIAFPTAFSTGSLGGEPALAGDVNGDGRADFVTSGLSLISTKRDGAWTYALDETMTTTINANEAAVGDIDGDGRDEIVLVPHYPMDSLQLSVVSFGDAGFNEPSVTVLLPDSGLFDATTRRVFLEDVTGDGLLDVVVVVLIKTPFIDDKLSPLPNGASLVVMPGSDQGFGAPEFVGIARGVADVIGYDNNYFQDLVDINNDGWLDVLTVRDQFFVNYGSEAGFAALELFSDTYPPGFTDADLRFGVYDVNRDALPDLVALGFEDLGVALLNPDGTWAETTVQGLPEFPGSNPTFQGRSIGSGVDGTDAIIFRDSEILSAETHLLSFDASGMAQLRPRMLRGGVPYFLGDADVDGDGIDEIAAWVRGRSTGFPEYDGVLMSVPRTGEPGSSEAHISFFPTPFGERQSNGLPEETYHVLAVDLDGDGIDEFVSSGFSRDATWIGYPATGVTDPAATPVNASGWRSLAGDLTGNGSLDILWFGNRRVNTAINDGSGHLTTGRWSMPRLNESIGPPLDIADVNGDGIYEVVFIGEGSIESAIETHQYRGEDFDQDTRPFERIGETQIHNIVGYFDVEFARLMDVNADGNLDFVLGARLTGGTRGLFALPGDGLGQFGADFIHLADGLSPYWFTVDDIDGDGFEDLLVRHDPYIDPDRARAFSRSTVSVLYGSAGGLGSAQPIFPETEIKGGEELITLDVDHNGLRDIVFCNRDMIYVHRQIEPRVFLSRPPDGVPNSETLLGPEAIISGAGVIGLASTDYNGDGYEDLVWSSTELVGSGAGPMYVLLNRGPAVSCPADLAPPIGVLNFFDVAAFIGLFSAQDPAADLAEPFGVWNFFDVAAFLDAYSAGCP